MVVFSRSRTKWKIGTLNIKGVYVMKEGGGDDVINVPKRRLKKIFNFNTFIGVYQDTYE